MKDKVGLAQAPRRNQCHIIPVGQQVDEPVRLINPVTKVMLAGITVGNKWIVHITSSFDSCCKVTTIHPDYQIIIIIK
jgi:hypothetical protein